MSRLSGEYAEKEPPAAGSSGDMCHRACFSERDHWPPTVLVAAPGRGPILKNPDAKREQTDPSDRSPECQVGVRGTKRGHGSQSSRSPRGRERAEHDDLQGRWALSQRVWQVTAM